MQVIIILLKSFKVSAESQVTSLIFFILQYNVDNVNARAVSKYHQRNHYRNKDINICTVAMRGMSYNWPMDFQ